MRGGLPGVGALVANHVFQPTGLAFGSAGG